MLCATEGRLSRPSGRNTKASLVAERATSRVMVMRLCGASPRRQVPARSGHGNPDIGRCDDRDEIVLDLATDGVESRSCSLNRELQATEALLPGVECVTKGSVGDRILLRHQGNGG